MAGLSPLPAPGRLVRSLWYDVVIAGIAVTCAGQAWTMARRGPASRLAVPAWLGANAQAGTGPSAPHLEGIVRSAGPAR